MESQSSDFLMGIFPLQGKPLGFNKSDTSIRAFLPTDAKPDGFSEETTCALNSIPEIH